MATLRLNKTDREGMKPFYSLLQPREKAQLPAVQVDEVNRLLGLKGTQTETTTQTKA